MERNLTCILCPRGCTLNVTVDGVANIKVSSDPQLIERAAEALLGKGAQLGVVLSFMMAVTTMSLPSVIMLKKAIKPKLLGIFIGICTAGIILVGYFFNAIQFLLV